jgi:lipopolysaccharide heptosyltransferase II
MFSQLQIPNPRERTLVGAADILVGFGRLLRRNHRSSRASAAPGRVLLLRLERIGDLLMVVSAIKRLRELLPDAEIDLVTGSWNAALAELLPSVNRTDILDAPWLSREADPLTPRQMIARAWSWRARRYDLALNFEPDIRSNILVWLSGARRRVGYWTGGGGGLLTESLAYDPMQHVSDNALRLVRAAAGIGKSTPGGPDSGSPSLLVTPLPAAVIRVLEGRRGRLIGLHASGGRAVKQWPPDRFRELAGGLIAEQDATMILTGSPGDGELVDAVSAGLPEDRVINLSGQLNLPELASLLGRLHLYITGDTGPMHLAHLVGTPVVALFGPSDPARYAPRGPHDRVVRVDLPCSPCNRIRQPPERCRGVTPDCLQGISVDSVVATVEAVLRAQVADTRPDVTGRQ